ncbi:MAG: SurA N-terminal domain-containing protein [Proteobacteria bacterium]|nr:SurA N-terminal domain-containing protein [Pseudomonadota bacterium]
MLDFMRKNAGSWMIKAILGIIVIVFVFWGVGSFSSKRTNRVAKVNGEVIDIREYQEAYNKLVEQVRAKLGSNFNEDIMKALNIKKRALDNIIFKRLLIQEAKKLKFSVSDSELRQVIVSIRDFQKGGAFNKNVYEKVLSLNHMVPDEFEASVRESIIIERLMSFITGSVKVTENEALKWFNWKGALVNVDYVFFDQDKYKDINPSTEELNNFFDKNKESYKTEKKVKVAYTLFGPDAYFDQVKVGDDEIKEYYESNIEEFMKPKTVDASHILCKVDEGASPEQIELAKQKADKVSKMIEEGQPFPKLAKKYSDCPSKANGGHLGAFEKKAMVEPFASKAFSMKEGEISEPILTRFGWHIIKVEKIIQEKTLSLKEEEHKIRTILINEKAKKLAYDEAEQLCSMAIDIKSLSKASEKLGIKIKTTDFFSKDDASDAKDADKQALVESGVFVMPDKEISDVKEIEDRYCVAQVMETMLPKIPDLDDVKDAVKVDLIKEIKREKAKKDAEDLLAALKKDDDLIKESKKYRLTPSQTGFFGRNGTIGSIGYEPQLSETAFKLSGNKQYTESPVKGNNGFYVIRFKERKYPLEQDFAKEKEKIEKALLEQKKETTFSSWLSEVKSNSEIIIEKEFQE